MIRTVTRHPQPCTAGASLLVGILALLVGQFLVGCAGPKPAATAATAAPTVVASVPPGADGLPGPTHTGTTTPTGSKRSESIMWFNDGRWWANLWDVTSQDFHIFVLDPATGMWVLTPTAVDWRPNTHADTLWTGTKLYVASHRFSADYEPAVAGYPSYLYRYSYDPDAKEYTLDAGFPTEINTFKVETLVIDIDSTGTLWATWQQDQRIFLSHTVGPDGIWAPGFPLPVATPVTVDDTATLLAVGRQIFLMWSDQTRGREGMYYALHDDGADPNAWTPRGVAISGPGSADDHMNLKYVDDGGGRVFAAVKTSFLKPRRVLSMLLEFHLATRRWEQHPIAEVADCPNRMLVLIDVEHRLVHTYGTYPAPPDLVCGPKGGRIDEKVASLDRIDFPPGPGTPRINDPGRKVRNVSSTKQNVDGGSGVTILADNEATDRYWYYSESLVPAS